MVGTTTTTTRARKAATVARLKELEQEATKIMTEINSVPPKAADADADADADAPPKAPEIATIPRPVPVSLTRHETTTSPTSSPATTSPPATLTTPLPLMPGPTGAELLSTAAVNVIGKTHDEMIRQIDEMVIRLQSLKGQVQHRRDSAESEVRVFIGTVGKALNIVNDLERVVKEIEQNHL
jgi:hypothetical protein